MKRCCVGRSIEGGTSVNYWRIVFRANLPLVLVALTALLLAHVLLENPTSSLDSRVANHLPNLLPIAGLFVVGALGVIALRASMNTENKLGRWERFTNWLRSVSWVELILGRFIFGYFLLEVNKFAFAAYKPHLPDFVPFSWDFTFVEIDRMLMFGYDPWEVTHALFPSASASFIIDKLYLIWFFVVLMFYMFAIVQPLTDWRRLAVLLTLMLSWLFSGGFIATIFSSAGPVFFYDLYGDPYFEPLMDRIREQSALTAPDLRFTVLNASEYLWNGYIGTEGHRFIGISAFPSMHVCLMAVLWLYARTYGRVWGWVAFAYMIAILIGSVHLGWHYLADGLVAIFLAWLIWTLCARFAQYWMAQPVGASQSSGIQSSNVVT